MNQHGSDEDGMPHTPPPAESPNADLPFPEPGAGSAGEAFDDEFEEFADDPEDVFDFEEGDDFDDGDDDEDSPRYDGSDDESAPWRAPGERFVPPSKRRLPPDEEPRVNHFARRARDEVHRRASGSVRRGFGEFADRLDEVADHIDRLATRQFAGSGSGENAADAAHLTAGWISGLSEYLRQSDLEAVRADLEQQVREYPLRSVILAAGAGWFLGRILR